MAIYVYREGGGVITRANVEFAKRIFYDRLGDEYVYGGTWNPLDTHAGCDCSGEVTDELGACVLGPGMHWDREGLSTESYRYLPLGPNQVGPFSLVHVRAPGDIPADAVVKIALHHEGAGGPDSHMWCEVDGVRMETNGSVGTCTAPVAMTIDNPYANDWWYLPGPIQEGGTPVTQPGENTLFADVSEFQVPVDNSYPYPVLSIRSNDGTYQDHHFFQNYQWCVKAADAGRLTCFIVYFYWRPEWQQAAQTHINMITAAGGPHPKMIAMIDVERGGNPAGDFSDALNGTDDMLVNWLGNPARVIAYGNTGDLSGMWANRREDQLIIAGYGSNPSYPGKIAHQYTDGQISAGGLPTGAAPFGNCDMNSADGVSPAQFAAQCGITTTSGDFLSALTDDEQREMLELLRQQAEYRRISRSPLRHLGEGPVDTCAGFAWSSDGNIHVVLVEILAVTYGDPTAIALLMEVATAVDHPDKYPDRQADALLAKRILGNVSEQHQQAAAAIVQQWLAAEAAAK